MLFHCSLTKHSPGGDLDWTSSKIDGTQDPFLFHILTQGFPFLLVHKGIVTQYSTLRFLVSQLKLRAFSWRSLVKSLHIQEENQSCVQRTHGFQRRNHWNNSIGISKWEEGAWMMWCEHDWRDGSQQLSVCLNQGLEWKSQCAAAQRPQVIGCTSKMTCDRPLLGHFNICETVIGTCLLA